MRRSSTNQLDLFGAAELSAAPTAIGAGSSAPLTQSADLGATTPSARTSTTSDVEFPEFDSYAGSQAETARIAGRIAASHVSEEEHQAFLRERQALLDKLFAKTITREEEIRLEYVRWSLDRIEDARHGADLDRLEGTISRYEHFLEEIEQFKGALEKMRMTRR
jgi:hypothetical protein